MKPINDFISQFNSSVSLDELFIVKKDSRYFLLNENLKRLALRSFFYAGVYLGKIKNGRFFPSFSLLRIMSERRANKVTVDDKTAWLFICGRDIFKQGIMKAVGSKRKGDYALILNEHGECLGFGRILSNLDEEKDDVAIKNISDIGDFLRREKQQA
jgi:ribosome biogenesis protein Nip4